VGYTSGNGTQGGRKAIHHLQRVHREAYTEVYPPITPREAYTGLYPPIHPGRLYWAIYPGYERFNTGLYPGWGVNPVYTRDGKVIPVYTRVMRGLIPVLPGYERFNPVFTGFGRIYPSYTRVWEDTLVIPGFMKS